MLSCCNLAGKQSHNYETVSHAVPVALFFLSISVNAQSYNLVCCQKKKKKKAVKDWGIKQDEIYLLDS